MLPATRPAPRRGLRPDRPRPRTAVPQAHRPRGCESPSRAQSSHGWPPVTAAELVELGEELGLDEVGAAPAEPYVGTERHIRERQTRGLFAGMRFTMAHPEVSCHPETLLPDARTVVSAALCYYAPGPAAERGEGTLSRYTWSDRYAELREKLDALGRRLGGS